MLEESNTTSVPTLLEYFKNADLLRPLAPFYAVAPPPVPLGLFTFVYLSAAFHAFVNNVSCWLIPAAKGAIAVQPSRKQGRRCWTLPSPKTVFATRKLSHATSSGISKQQYHQPDCSGPAQVQKSAKH